MLLGNLVKDNILKTSDKDKEEYLFEEYFTGKHLSKLPVDTNQDNQIEIEYSEAMEKAKSEKSCTRNWNYALSGCTHIN